MESCIFCKIISKEIPAKVVYEDQNILAFQDIEPQAPCHILWVPKKHIAGLDELTVEDSSTIAEMLFTIKKYAEEHETARDGYRIVTNIGPHGRQSVRHLHFHLLAGRELSEILG